MDKHTHVEWQRMADIFSKVQPSSPEWFALADMVITAMIRDKLAETRPLPKGERDSG